jgi:fibronectin-binding autotransporter adhesin
MYLRFPASSLALVFLAASADFGFGQTVWQAGTGDWFTAANWTLGVPNSASPTAFDAIISNGGTAQLQAPGGSVRRMRVGVVGGPGSLLVNAGTLNVTDDLHLNEGSAGPASMTVQGGSTVTAIDTVVGFSSAFSTSFLISDPGTVYNATTSFIVGQSGAGLATLTVQNGAVLASGTSTMASNGFGNATVDGAGSRWSSTGTFTVGNVGTATLTIQNQGTVHVGTLLNIGSTSTINLNGGTLRFSTNNASLNRLNYTAGTIQLAGNRTLDSDETVTFLYGPFLAPPASITIAAGKGLKVEGNASQFQNNRTVTVNGGSLSSTNHTIGILTNGGGFVVVNNGGTVTTTANVTFGDVANSFGTATVSGAGSSWTIGAAATIGSGGVGTLSILDQALVHIGSTLSINSASTVTLNGGTLRFNTISGLNRLTYTAGTIQLAGDRGVGVDATITTLYGASPILPTGKGLTVEGTATLTKPVTINGGAFKTTSLLVGVGGSLFFDHGILELAGGSISGLSNLVVPANGEFRASGAATTRITAAAGSIITATGSLTLGDVGSPNGFYGNGDLVMGANAVTLADANDAVLDSGSLTTLGAGGSPGMLAAANGLTLDFGGNVTGFGAIDTPDDVAKPFINNGHITGDSGAEPLTLSGYVKGVGTFDNVNFTGTFSPGLSPTILTVGNVALSPTSTLLMELGGIAPGGGHDQILSSGTLGFDGTLQLALINGFSPAAGQTFNLFDWASMSGTFDTLGLPSLGAGLSWDTSQLYIQGVLSVSAGLAGDFDFDGDVDGRDFLTWQRNPSIGNLADWQTNYGVGALTAASTAVPEPSAMLTAAFAMTIVSTIRRRRLGSLNVHWTRARFPFFIDRKQP